MASTYKNIVGPKNVLSFFPLFTINILARPSKGLPDTGYWIKCLGCDWKLSNQCILGFKAILMLLRRAVSFDSPSSEISRDVGVTEYFFFLIGHF